MSSSSSPVLTFAIRSIQALFAIVVFGLSCSLIKGHKLGDLPSTLGFVAFIGGVSFVGALLGVAAHWLQMLQGKVGLLIDTGMCGLNIAGGILMAIKMRGVRCNDDYDSGMDESDIVCGGILKQDGVTNCALQSETSQLITRCKMSQADTVFMFLIAIVAAGAAVLAYLRHKRGY